MILYLGIDLPVSYQNKKVIHYPIIQIVPRPPTHPDIVQAFGDVARYTHLIFTSKNAVRLFFEYASLFGVAPEQIREKFTLAVGRSTAERVRALGGNVEVIAKVETAEGVMEELRQLNLGEGADLFWPHSKLSRATLTQFFEENQLKFNACIFYDTIPHLKGPLPNLKEIDEIVFTSPSTIEAFLKIFGPIPIDKKIRCLGPITQSCYNRLLN